jgi:hypothetical protein
VDNSSSDRVKHLYDHCLVRTPQAQRRRTLEGHPNQLGHRLLRVLPASPRQPHRFRNLLTLSAQSHPGGYHPQRLRSLHRLLLRRKASLEPRRGLLLPHRRSLLHVPQVLISSRTKRKTSRLSIDWSRAAPNIIVRVLPDTSPPQAQPCTPIPQP